MSHTAATKQRQQVEAQLQALETDAQRLAEERRQLKKQLSTLREQERQHRVTLYGELVCHVGLDGIEPEVLLGALSQLAQGIKEPKTVRPYRQAGTPLLEDFQKRKRRRVRPAETPLDLREENVQTELLDHC